jgi:integrase
VARPIEPPRVVMWRGNHYLFYHDFSKGQNVRKSCAVLGAVSKEQRVKLVKDYTARHISAMADNLTLRPATAFDTPLSEALDRYRANITERVQARQENPKAREGISPHTGSQARYILAQLESYLASKGQSEMTTGELDADVLESFIRHLARETVERGVRKGRRSASTLNRHRRYLGGCLRWLNERRPKLFPDADVFWRALKSRPVDLDEPSAYSPKQLRTFLTKALEHEAPGRSVTVKDRRRRQYQLPVNTSARTPTSYVFSLVALTGMRLGEALGLRWDDVDLKRGRITIHAQKTGRRRVLPLVNAPEGDVAPGLLDRLREWKAQDPKREFVLPYAKGENGEGPTLNRQIWKRIAKAAGVPDLMPQRLRQNFVSYCASCGIPSSVAAAWAGHGVLVAERHYRAQVLDRNQGESIEQAMGLEPET